ncbi:hypothetical protein K445DRAFT_20690 [Daldinia sp. EC12]|nr:hypothetical protein K445DRAFT_20690 [Daldinia sp. EC12]
MRPSLLASGDLLRDPRAKGGKGGNSWTTTELLLVFVIGYTMIGDIRLPIDEMTGLIFRAEEHADDMVWCQVKVESGYQPVLRSRWIWGSEKECGSEGHIEANLSSRRIGFGVLARSAPEDWR